MKLPKSPNSLWFIFILVNLWTILIISRTWEGVMGDVSWYCAMALKGLAIGEWPVLNDDWVYPVAALIPITLPALFIPIHNWVYPVNPENSLEAIIPVNLQNEFNSSIQLYSFMWLMLIVIYNSIAFWFLLKSGKNASKAALWWLVFLAALGPVWMARLEGVIAPMILITLVLVSKRPRIAVAIATLGAWIKISPGAIVLALVSVSRKFRGLFRNIIIPGVAVSLLVIVLALVGGAGKRVLGFFSGQGTRSLQIESVAATGFSLARLWDKSIIFEFSSETFTTEVKSNTASVIASWLDTTMILTVLLIAILTWFAARSVEKLPSDIPKDTTQCIIDVLFISVLAFISALIVFNKVGSVQFIAWLGPCIAAGIALATPSMRRCWRFPAVIMILICGLSQILFPFNLTNFAFFPDEFIYLVIAVAIRNLLLISLLVWSLWRLTALARCLKKAT